MRTGLKEWGTEVTDFLAEIGKAAEARVLRDLRELASKRHLLRNINKPVGDGLFEITTSFNGMEYRCVYVFHDNEIVILVCFVKKKQKMPLTRIRLAKTRYSKLVKEEVELGNVTLH